MSYGALNEHRGYLNDERRSAAYRAALAEVVTPTDVVLDLGAGTGLLGYFACEAGAKAVVAIDRGDILGLARRIAADNGYASRITHIQGLSTQTALEEPVDVVVCDQIGGLVHDAGVLSFFADARRVLAPGGRMVPESFRLFLAPVEFDLGRSAVDFWDTKPSSVDVSAARALAANTEWHHTVAAEEIGRLATGQRVASFRSDHIDPINGSAEFSVGRAGRFDGFVGWFEAQLSPSVVLTNDPWSPDRFDRWYNFYAINESLDVRAGDRINVRLDIRPRLEVVTWTTEVAHSDGRVVRGRQTTFEGRFLTTDTVDRFAVGQAVARSDRIEHLQAVMDLIDGRRSQADIVAALADRIGDRFSSTSHLEDFVRRVVSLAR